MFRDIAWKFGGGAKRPRSGLKEHGHQERQQGYYNKYPHPFRYNTDNLSIEETMLLGLSIPISHSVLYMKNYLGVYSKPFLIGTQMLLTGLQNECVKRMEDG